MALVAFSNYFKESIVINITDNISNKILDEQALEVGVDNIGRYKDIKEKDGNVKRIYFIESDKIKSILADRYNTLHRYRREEDVIVFYYNEDTGEKIILAVKPGDDLSRHPFNLQEEFIVTEEEISINKVTPKKGMVAITKNNLEDLIKCNVLTDETAYVIYYNKENVGFSL